MNMGMQISLRKWFHFLLDIYWEIGSMNHMIFLIFEEYPYIYIPNNSIPGFPFSLCPSQQLLSFVFFINDLLKCSICKCNEVKHTKMWYACASCWLFNLDDLSSIECGVLKSHIFLVFLFVLLFMSVTIYLILGAPILYSHIFVIVTSLDLLMPLS